MHQLKSDNTNLEKRLTNLHLRKERLLAINARLAASFPHPFNNNTKTTNKPSLSDMLSKLNASCAASSNIATTVKQELNKDEKDEIISKSKKARKSEDSNDSKASTQSSNETQLVSSDLAMLAAASIKHDIRSPAVTDERPPNLFSSISGESTLIQPNIEFASHSHTSSSQVSTNKLLNGMLISEAHKNHIKNT